LQNDLLFWEIVLSAELRKINLLTTYWQKEKENSATQKEIGSIRI